MDSTKVFLSKEFLLFLVAVLLLGWVCYDGLVAMAGYWERDEYSHGYMIPLVAGYLVWQKREELTHVTQPGKMLGILVLLGAMFFWLLGEVSSIYTIIQYAFLLGLWGLTLLWVGTRGVRVIWAGLFYLVFMVPLPSFLYFNLSQELQLISSSIGVGVIRLFGISVFLEGNVIDLGVYQLQVVEACSGLRYLFPLMSFGFLIAYIYRGPFWQRLIIFLSTIPITVLMNSFRIGVIGVTVEHFGIAAAEGFLHDFEGWFVFMACLGVLLVEIWLFYLLSKRRASFSSFFDLDFGANSSLSDKANSHFKRAASDKVVGHYKMSTHAWIGLSLLIIAVPLSTYIIERQDSVPERTAFIEFPLHTNGWIGRENSLEQNVLDSLDLTDYIIGDFRRSGDDLTVNLYVAWYEEQRKGASIHSPKTCLPGGGWLIQSHTIAPLTSIEAYGAPLNVNRVLMQMGEHQQLVYYWFQGRGRNITNEYMAKWYIFWDSLTRNRTDGALVRLVTYVPEGSNIADAEARLNTFLADYYGKLPNYIPD